MNKKFDFSEIDGALPTAEKMQEQDRIIDALKNNYEAVRILSANVEKLENRLSEALPKMDGAVSSLRGASTVTLGEEARKTLEQEGEKICRKMADRMERECARLAGRLSANDRVLISATAFWCINVYGRSEDDVIINDLIERDVVVNDKLYVGEKRIKIKVQLYKEWINNNAD